MLKLSWCNSYDNIKTANDVLNLLERSTGWMESDRDELHNIYNTRCRYYDRQCMKNRLGPNEKCNERTKKFCPFYRQLNKEPIRGTIVTIRKVCQAIND
jgi:hypothetical protein